MQETDELHASKKRKMGERVVVSVKIEENGKKQQKSEGPPSDCWSWRKYGQKPIKGSPYPRGYYKCSTSKGCSAKKQVERCKTDASMLIITYTSTHNHPGPDSSTSTTTDDKLEQQKLENSESDSATVEIVDAHTTTSKQEQEVEAEPEMEPRDQNSVNNDTEEDQFHYSQSPFSPSQEHITVNQEGNPFAENIDQTHAVLYNEELVQPFPDESMNFSSLRKSEENDFFDELEELPTSSFFTAFMKNSFSEERILVNPS